MSKPSTVYREIRPAPVPAWHVVSQPREEFSSQKSRKTRRKPDHGDSSDRFREQHSLASQPSASFSCTECGRYFKHKHHLLQHRRSHTNERPYSCSVCEKAFKQLGHLRNHVRAIHTEAKPYVCPVLDCAYSSSQRGNFQRHLSRDVHSCKSAAVAPQATYPIVGSIFDNINQKPQFVMQSQRAERVVKKWLCEACGSVFFSQSLLHKHQLMRHCADDGLVM